MHKNMRYKSCIYINYNINSTKVKCFFAKKYGANCSVEKYEQTRSLKVLRLKNFTSIPYISFFYYLVSLVGYSNTLINHTSLFYKLIISSSTYIFFPVLESLFWQLLHATGYVFFLFFLQVCPFFLFVFSYFSVSTDTLSDWFRFLLLCTDMLFLTMIPNQLFDIYRMHSWISFLFPAISDDALHFCNNCLTSSRSLLLIASQISSFVSF